MVVATRELVAQVAAAGEAVGDGLPVLEREIAGPTSCLDGDGHQGSIAWTVVLDEEPDVDAVLSSVAQRWEAEGLEVTRNEDDPALPRVQAENRGGGQLTAELVRATGTLHYFGSTACRPLPDDVDDANRLRSEFRALVDPDGEQVSQDTSRSLADQVADLRAGDG